jgi:hypothetical protein
MCLKRRILYVELTDEEKREIFNAIRSGDATMQHYGPGGYTGQGHWYTCPKGHVYVIGEPYITAFYTQ